jgi:hypothetical protein
VESLQWRRRRGATAASSVLCGLVQGCGPAETDVRQAVGLGASFSYPHRRKQSQRAGLGNSACV